MVIANVLPIRDLPLITRSTETREYHAAAANQALLYDDYELIVDMDAHLQEKSFWPEVLSCLGSHGECVRDAAAQCSIPPFRRAKTSSAHQARSD